MKFSFIFLSILLTFSLCADLDHTEDSYHQLNPGIGIRYPQKNQFSDEFCEFVLESSPQELCDKIILLQDPECPEKLKPQRILLFGPSGSGKTTLAQVIAQIIDRPVIFINAGLLGNEYKNSAAQNLRRAIEPYLYVPCVIIVDEIDCIVRQSANEKNPDIDTPKQIWEIFDLCQQSPNLLLIGITNDLSGMPEPLQTRFAGDTIEIPLLQSNQMRQKTILFHLKNSFFDYDQSYIPSLSKKTKKYSHRELEKMVTIALSIAYLRCSNSPCVTKSDFETAFQRIEKSRAVLSKFKWSDYEKHLQYGLQIAGLVVNVASLITTLRMSWLSYCTARESLDHQKQAAAQSNELGQKNLAQSKELGDRSYQQAEKGMLQSNQQFEKSQELQKNLASESHMHAEKINAKSMAQSVDQFEKSQQLQKTLAVESQVHSEKMSEKQLLQSADQFEKNQKQTQAIADQADFNAKLGLGLQGINTVATCFVPGWGLLKKCFGY
jgi:ABC-type oligopeptide transport system ATPase subunit